MRTINAKFLLFLVIAIVVTIGALFGLHRLQASNIAEAVLWQASQAEKDGNFDRAAKFLARYLEFAREDLDQRAHLAMILSDPAVAVSAQRRARARFVIEQVLAKDPERHLLRHRLCHIAMASRSFEMAKEHLTYLAKNQSNSADVPFLYGVWHEAQNQLPAAAEQYRLAVKIDGNKVEAYTRLVGVLKQMDFGKQPRNAAEIEQLIVSALEKAPHDAAVLSMAAHHAQEKGDARIALRYLEDGLQHHPNEPKLYLALARVYGQNGKRADAIDQLKVGLQKVRKDQRHELRWSLANLLLDENRPDDAQKISAEIREHNPLSADYLDARMLMQRGRWFEACKQFERIRPASKSVKELSLQIDLFLGACYEKLEEPALQLTAFQRAAETDPTSLTARRGKANARWALGQTGEAITIYQELVAHTKDPEEAARRRVEYVRMLLQTGLPRQAKEWSKIEEELTAAEKTLVKSMDVALLRAEILFVRGDKEKAEGLLHETIKEKSDRHEPWMVLMSFAVAKDDQASAKQLMQTAEARFKDKADFRLAQVRFWMQHRPSDASASMQRLEGELGGFTAREQSRLLQALTEGYYFASQYADGARVLQRLCALPQHAEDVRVRMQLLEVALLLDDDAQARAVLKDIKRIEGDRAGAADWSFGEALRLMRLGRNGSKESLEQARHLLTVSAAQRPNWHPIVQARAELDELQGRLDQAMANYRRALDLGSQDPHVMKQLISLLSQAHRFDEVDEVIARMQKLYGTTDDIVKGFVHNAYHRQDYQKAEYLAKQMVAKNSKNYRDHLWLGHVLTASGKSSKEAEQAFRQAVALAPRKPEAWIGLVRYLVVTGQLAAANTEIDNIKMAHLPEGKDLTLAQCSELIGAPADAAGYYQAAVKQQPESALMHRAAGDFFARMGRPIEAELLFRRIAERTIPADDEEITFARRGLALALAKRNQPASISEALTLVGLTRDDNGKVPDEKIAESIDEQLVQAKVLASIQHHRLQGKAIALLETLNKKNALVAEDQFLLARLQAQHDRALWQKTRQLLKALTLNHPKNARYLGFTAHMLIQNKEFTEAEQAIARLEQLERERKVVAGGFGSIELRAKALEVRGFGSQSIALLTSYAEQSDAGSPRRLLLAGLHGRLGNFREAIDLCEQVRQIGKNANEANVAALAILRGNKPSEAQPTKHEQWLQQRNRVESILRDALAREPGNISLRLHMADVMEMQGKFQEVEKICRDVLRDSDANLVALNNLAWQLGLHENQTAEALTLINRAIDKHGPRPELLDTRAIILLRRGNLDESVRDLERVVNEAPTAARLFHLSQAYERVKNAKATEALRRANEMGLSVQQLHPAEHTDYHRAIATLEKRL